MVSNINMARSARFQPRKSPLTCARSRTWIHCEDERECHRRRAPRVRVRRICVSPYAENDEPEQKHRRSDATADDRSEHDYSDRGSSCQRNVRRREGGTKSHPRGAVSDATKWGETIFLASCLSLSLGQMAIRHVATGKMQMSLC